MTKFIREPLRNEIDYLFYYYNDDEDEEKKLEEKKLRELQLKKEDEAKKRSIIVRTILDLLEKYEDYNVKVDTDRNTIILRKPLEVKYLAQLRYECNYLGFKFEIGDGSIEDMYYRKNHI